VRPTIATDFSTLVPTEAVGELIAALQQVSVTMRLGNVIPMGAGQATVPVSRTAPTAKFVQPTYGGRKPASAYPPGRVAAAAAPIISDTDPAKALDDAMTAVERTGLIPNGVARAPLLRSALRRISLQQLVPASATPDYAYDGVPTATTPVWDVTKGGDAIVGDWTKRLVGVRQDVTVETSNDGVLLNDDGTIAVSAFQDDMVLMPAYIRIGVVSASP
jgi:hypothetical protein